MRIALVNTSLEPGRGSDIVVNGLAGHLAQRHDVTVYALRPVLAETSFRVVAPAHGSGGLSGAVQILRKIAREADRYDVIHSHHALISLALPKARLVTSYHGYCGRLAPPGLGTWLADAANALVRRGLIGPALRRSRQVAIVSHALADEARRSGNHNWRVIYNGVDRLDAHPERAPTHFLYLGRIDPEKSVGKLLEAFDKARVPVPLLVVGDGTERQQLEARYAGPRIRFLGRRTREELPALFASSYAFVTASEFESFCLPVLEAAQFGCPSIAFATCGALPEVIRPGVTGTLAEPGQLTAAIEALWELPPDQRSAMQSACREWAEGFAWEHAVAGYEALYQTIAPVDAATGQRGSHGGGPVHT